MKKHYSLFVGMLFACMFVANAQDCPPSLANGSSATTLIFSLTGGSYPCGSYPETITIGSATYTKGYCHGNSLEYVLASGSIGDDQNFTVSFGLNTCEYVDGVLASETLSTADNTLLSERIKLFPNPIASGNTLKIDLGARLEAKIEIYNITGKLVLAENTNRLSEKELNVSSLTNGIYIVKVSANTTSISRKLVIMK